MVVGWEEGMGKVTQMNCLIKKSSGSSSQWERIFRRSFY